MIASFFVSHPHMNSQLHAMIQHELFQSAHYSLNDIQNKYQFCWLEETAKLLLNQVNVIDKKVRAILVLTCSVVVATHFLIFHQSLYSHY